MKGNNSKYISEILDIKKPWLGAKVATIDLSSFSTLNVGRVND